MIIMIKKNNKVVQYNEGKDQVDDNHDNDDGHDVEDNDNDDKKQQILRIMIMMIKSSRCWSQRKACRSQELRLRLISRAGDYQCHECHKCHQY